MTYKILVVDDEIESRVVIKETLADIGVETAVTTAANGSEAIERATSEDFDLVIMDLLMPVMNGVEALKLIHMSEPEIPIIVVTGATEEEIKQHALQGGANIILQKPIDAEELAAAVRKLLGVAGER